MLLTSAGNMLPTKVQESFLQNVSYKMFHWYKFEHYTVV